MPGDLTGVHLKLKQAKVHLDALDSRADSASGNSLHGLVCEPDTDPGQYLIKVKRVGSDEDWPLILGDFVHNLFVALDHLVWQLVLANNDMPDRGNEFGVFLEPTDFDGAKGNRDFRGIHSDARAAIRAVQPFSLVNERPLGDRHPLWILRNLEVVDKHHLIHTISLAPDGVVLRFRESLRQDQVEMFDLSDRIVKDGTEVCRITSDAQPKVEMDSTIGMQVFIEKTDSTPRLEWGWLDAIRNEVDRVVRILTPFVVWPP